MQHSKVISRLVNAAIFIVLEIAALTMLANNGRMQNIWFSKICHAIMGNVWGCTQQVKEYFSLKKINDALAIENHELRMRISYLESVNPEAEIPDLEDGKCGKFRYIPASVMKTSNGSNHNYLIVDKGSKDGVVIGSGIITGKGAVGVIDAVSRNYSYARSFKNFEMSISSRIGRVGPVGPLSWDGMSSHGAVLKEIPCHCEFSPGDTVFTSGFSTIFPQDIPLGTVEGSKIVNGATFDVSVTLFEDFSSARYVTIVENLDKNEIKDLEESR